MKILGHVVSGSLADGFDINIEDIDEMRTGKFVSIQAQQGRFFFFGGVDQNNLLLIYVFSPN